MPQGDAVVVLVPPSPPGMNIGRDWAGGMGTASASDRADYGRDANAFVVPHTSSLCVASVLEQVGYRVVLVDALAERLSKAQTVARVRAEAPAAVVAAFCLPSIYADLALMRALREVVPQALLVTIGPVCRALPEVVLETGAVDVAITGEPELVLPRVLACRGERGWGDKGVACLDGEEMVVSPQGPSLTSLDDLPPPAYHLAPMERYWMPSFGEGVPVAGILTSRGCPFPCAYYCPYPFGFGKRVAFKSAERAGDEIELLYRDHGVRSLVMRDQVFTLNGKHAESICDQIFDRGLRLQWVCETRFDCISEGLLEKMKAAGCCSVHYGLETGDATLLTSTAKPGATLDQAADAIAATKRTGMRAHCHLLIGFPEDSWRTLRQTMKVVKRWRPDTLQIAIMTPYPGTKLYRQAREEGLVTTADWSQYTGFNAVMRTRHLEVSELEKAREWLSAEYYRIPFAARARNRVAASVRSLAGRLGRSRGALLDASADDESQARLRSRLD